MTDFKRTNKKQARVGKRPKIRVYILSRVLTTYCAVFYLSFISQRLRQSLAQIITPRCKCNGVLLLIYFKHFFIDNRLAFINRTINVIMSKIPMFVFYVTFILIKKLVFFLRLPRLFARFTIGG